LFPADLPDFINPFSAECNSPVPAPKTLFILFGLPGTVQPVSGEDRRRLSLYCVLAMDVS